MNLPPPPEGVTFVEEGPHQGRNFYVELQRAFPNASFSSGYRTREYQENMRRRNYNPANNSLHLEGAGIDIPDFGDGGSLSEGARMLREQFPEARIVYGDRDHLDHVHFEIPGYTGFPAFGGARDFGVYNENADLPPAPDGVTFVDEAPAAAAPEQASTSIELPPGPPPPQTLEERAAANRAEIGRTGISAGPRETELYDTEGNRPEGIDSIMGSVDAVFRRTDLPMDQRIELVRGFLAENDLDLAPETIAYYTRQQDAEVPSAVYRGDPDAEAQDAGFWRTLGTAINQGGTLNATDEMGLQDREVIEQLRQERPYTYAVGQAIGALSLLPLAAASTAPGVVGAEGAAYAIGEGIGEREGSLSERLNPADMLLDAALGGGGGVALSGVFRGFTRGNDRFTPTQSRTRSQRQGEFGTRPRQEPDPETIEVTADRSGRELVTVRNPETGNETTAWLSRDGEAGAITLQNGIDEADIDHFVATIADNYPDIKRLNDENGSIDLDTGEVLARRADDRPENIEDLVRENNENSPLNTDRPDVDPRDTAEGLEEPFSPFKPGAPDQMATTRTDRGLRALLEERGVPENLIDEAERVAGRQADEAQGTPRDRREQAASEVDVDATLGRMSEQMKKARRTGPEQERARRDERARRTSRARDAGQQAFGAGRGTAQLGALKGELPRTEFESIRGNFTEAEMDAVYERIYNTFPTEPYAHLKAREGFDTLLDGRLPPPHQLRLMREVFDDDFMKAAVARLSPAERGFQTVADILGTPRALMSSGELSAFLRQGLYAVGEPAYYRNLPATFRNAFSEEQFEAAMRDLATRENSTSGLYDRAKLAITNRDGPISNREEDFMTTLPQRIPVVGQMVKASERGYVSFLNTLRADMFDDMMADYARLGIDLNDNIDLARQVASYVNAATGRGNLPQFMEAWRPMLNALLFSPGLISSRLHLLDPSLYVTGLQTPALVRNSINRAGYRLAGNRESAAMFNLSNPVVRRHAVRNLLAAGSLQLSMMGAAIMAGADIETDPTSSDFGKIRFGTERHDVMGGLSQYMTLAARIALDSRRTIRGDVLTNEEARTNDFEYMLRFARNKLSPVASYLVDYWIGENAIGEEFDWARSAAERMAPLFYQDVLDAARIEGNPLRAAGTFFGTGYSNFPAVPDDAMWRIQNNPDDPVAIEVDRLENGITGSIIGRPRNYISIGGERYDLSEEQMMAYESLSNQFIYEEIQIAMQDPEWEMMSDEERIEEIEDIKKDEREAAREILIERWLPPAPEGVTFVEE